MKPGQTIYIVSKNEVVSMIVKEIFPMNVIHVEFEGKLHMTAKKFYSTTPQGAWKKYLKNRQEHLKHLLKSQCSMDKYATQIIKRHQTEMKSIEKQQQNIEKSIQTAKADIEQTLEKV